MWYNRGCEKIMFKCAFCEKDITPSLGMIIPGDFSARYSDGVLKSLMVRAMVISDGKHTVALAVVDSCGLYADVAESVRRRVSKSTGISAEAVMIMATHSHSAGPTLNWGEEIYVNPKYIDLLTEKTSDAITEAFKNMREVSLFTNASVLEGVSFIRIFRMKGGGLRTNPGVGNPDIVEPACEIDRELSVVYMLENGKPTGAIINFALHPAIVCGTKSHGDYISVVAEEMKKKFGDGFITLFINGACGNINHINPFDERTVQPGIHNVIGKKIADCAISLLGNAEEKNGDISYASSRIKLRRRRASADELISAAKHLDSFGDQLENSGPGTLGYKETFFALQAMLSRVDRTVFTETELQAIKIGKIHIYGVPAQIFCEFGKKIKNNSSFSMVSAFANDYIGYIPTPECMKPGVYEARLASTSRHTAEAGDIICKEMEKLHKQL